jgi:hypothetical protein
MSPTARAWAKEHGMSEQEFARYLIRRHEESGDPFAHDTGGHAAGTDSIRGLKNQAPPASSSDFPFEDGATDDADKIFR